MTNLKKIGLTALAGSLVATSAFAGSLSVSGGAKLSYTSKQGTTDIAGLGSTGNRFGMQKLMSFNGSGELDNGNTVSLYHGMTVEGAQSSSTLTYDMGDMGKIMYTDAAGGLGIAGIDDLMPTAVEEPWDGLGGTKNGYAAHASSGFEYTNTSVDGVDVQVAYSPKSQAANDDGGISGEGGLKSAASVAVQYTGIEGANIFFGTGSNGATATTENDYDTMGVKYSMGAATVGLQRTDVDPAAGGDEENTAYGISFAVNDDLSISYGESTVEVAGSVDQEISGMSIGYSMGGLTLQAHANEGDNVGNTANNHKHTELTISFAF
jgi:outer membrane protein OmpU